MLIKIYFLLRNISRFSTIYLNRSSKWGEFKLPNTFNILKIRNKKQNNNNNNNISNKLEINDVVDNWSKTNNSISNLLLPKEETILVKRFTNLTNIEKSLLTSNLTNTNNSEISLNSIQEITLEANDPNSKNNYSKLLIKKRSNDGIYFCQLSLRNNDTTNVLFELGNLIETEKYIEQYIKIFTEDGRRSVSIQTTWFAENIHNKINNSNNNNVGNLQQSIMMKSQFDLNTSMSAWSNEIDLELKKKTNKKNF